MNGCPLCQSTLEINEACGVAACQRPQCALFRVLIPIEQMQRLVYIREDISDAESMRARWLAMTDEASPMDTHG